MPRDLALIIPAGVKSSRLIFGNRNEIVLLWFPANVLDKIEVATVYHAGYELLGNARLVHLASPQVESALIAMSHKVFASGLECGAIKAKRIAANVASSRLFI